MVQLVELQKQKQAFEDLDAELISVLRENKEGIAGLKEAYAKTQFDIILDDTPATQTKDYSKELWATYFIDKEGIVKAVLTGTKKQRPDAEAVLTQAQASFK
ncbi:peroxiredoxin family protein [Rubritalea spongiae]|uniref:Peroxiredoxin family protein n=1 Tax=Rubritalea spongiae TaxID=430797 RepID=A0ABW5E454_9BACT